MNNAYCTFSQTKNGKTTTRRALCGDPNQMARKDNKNEPVKYARAPDGKVIWSVDPALRGKLATAEDKEKDLKAATKTGKKESEKPVQKQADGDGKKEWPEAPDADSPLDQEAETRASENEEPIKKYSQDDPNLNIPQSTRNHFRSMNNDPTIPKGDVGSPPPQRPKHKGPQEGEWDEGGEEPLKKAFTPTKTLHHTPSGPSSSGVVQRPGQMALHQAVGDLAHHAPAGMGTRNSRDSTLQNHLYGMVQGAGGKGLLGKSGATYRVQKSRNKNEAPMFDVTPAIPQINLNRYQRD